MIDAIATSFSTQSYCLSLVTKSDERRRLTWTIPIREVVKNGILLLPDTSSPEAKPKVKKDVRITLSVHSHLSYPGGLVPDTAIESHTCTFQWGRAGYLACESTVFTTNKLAVHGHSESSRNIGLSLGKGQVRALANLQAVLHVLAVFTVRPILGCVCFDNITFLL